MANGIGYKMTKKETALQFTVLGRGVFPLDMLRYDGCHPKLEADSATIRADGLREVTLHKTLNWGTPHELLKIWVPTVGRWNSFGWAVLSDLPANRLGEGALTHNATLISRLKQPMKRPRAGVISSPQPAGTDARDGGLRPVDDGADAAGLRPDLAQEFP